MTNTDTVPARSRPCYKPEPGSPAAPLSVLPFVKDGAWVPNKCWTVPPADYAEACQKGREYAAHFVQYLLDNPFWVGSNTLGLIVEDMDFTDDGRSDGYDTKGYHVGFFSFLEQLLYQAGRRGDVWASFDRETALYRKILERRAAESAQAGPEANGGPAQ